MGVKDIGIALAKRLKTINNLRVYSPEKLPKTVNQFPVALILTDDIPYHDTHGGASYYTINYRVIVAVANIDQPEKLSQLVDYVEPEGEKSVVAAIEGDGTLYGEASDCWVLSNSGMGSTVWGGKALLSTEFTVRVLS